MRGKDGKKLKFIYWFAFYNLQSPSIRYRGYYPLSCFKKQYGINSFFVIPGYSLNRILKFIHAYFSALFFRKAGSLIVIQRLNTNWIYSTALKLLVTLRKKDTVYDLDDADYLINPPKSIFFFIKNCAAVYAGSHELAKKLSAFNNNVFIHTSPAPDLNIVKKHKNTVLTVGWIGDFGPGHKESLLASFFPSLNDLPFTIKLLLLGVENKDEILYLRRYFNDIKMVELEMPQQINWTDEIEVQSLVSQFDIGIATLLDDELHRSKSGFKAKQYLNNGVPVLSSDIPENNSVVQHGYNGYLCRTPDEFRQRIKEIHEMDLDNYAQLSENARKSIKNFNLEKYCNDIIQSYISGKSA